MNFDGIVTNHNQLVLKIHVTQIKNILFAGICFEICFGVFNGFELRPLITKHKIQRY